MRKEEESGAAGVVFVETSEDADREELAEDRSGFVDGLLEEFVGAGTKELDAICEKSVDWRAGKLCVSHGSAGKKRVGNLPVAGSLGL